MKLSRTAIKELTAAYRAVLKHAFIAAMGAMVVIGGASADDTKTRLVVDVDATENLAGVHDGYISTENGSVAQVLGVLNVLNGAQFTNNKTDGNGGAIFNSGTLTLGDGVSFTGNSAKFGGAVWNDGKMEIAAGTKFVGNNSKSAAGALYNSSAGTLDNLIGVVFENNTAAMGGAINNAKTSASVKGGTIDLISKSHFIGNSGGKSQGGAIRNQGTISTITDSVFDSNVAGNGGAINNGTWGSVVEGIYQTKFINNTAVVGPAQQGGAIVNAGHIGIIDGAVFESNRAGKIGGAIANVTPQNNGSGLAEVNIANSTFTGNVAGESGGAIYNATGGAVTLSGGNTFTGNTAGKSGGAIFNEGTLTLGDGMLFSGNSAASEGGAIKNTGKIEILGKNRFVGNHSNYGGAIQNAGEITIHDAEFDSNISDGFGGAIDNDKTLKIYNSKFINNKTENSYGGAVSALTKNGSDTTIKETVFENNYAKYAGAVYSGPDSVGLELEDVVFKNNSATEIGALGAYSANTKITKAKFYQNKALSDAADADGAGALFFGAVTGTKIADTEFIENTSAARGGAMASRLAYWTNSGKIDILNSKFVGNVAATEGGVFDNSHHDSVGASGSVYMSGNTFAQNKAARGGVVYNRGLADKENKVGSITLADSNFVNNIATEQGGALFNEAGALMTLTGNNVFTGNMAGGVGNDIYNLGKLMVTGGTTTIDGGIAGDGALTIADGATLNIGTTTVQQKELTLDGTVGATIVGANNYGKLLAETYNGNGKVSLNVATTGTYNIFGENANEYTVVDAGAIYDVTKGDNGAVTIATKKVEEIAADTGLTNVAANRVAALANADNDLANIASLNAQQALRNGDTDYVEIESAKANPVDKPVVQSVAQSVQGAVMTLAANRMAGAPSAGTMGRSGGDLSDADYGVWAQGMFNKSKFNGQFNGYTRGVSAGFDALIDKQYTIGLGYAFGHSDVHANGGRDTEIDSNSIFAYAQYKPSEWFVNAALNYTMSKYTETVDAFGVRLKSDYDTDAFGGQVMTGYDFASGLTPEIGLRYLHVTQDSYNNGLNHVSSDDTDFLTGIAGMKYRFAIENDSVINWFPELRAAATYDFVSDKAMSTVTMPGAASYVVDGDRLSRFGGEFGIGLTAEYNGLEISLVYDLDLHQDYTSQTGMAKFRYEF